jgi:hypothetical protein
MNKRERLKMAAAIHRDGICIGGDHEPHECALTYSVGRFERGWPELAVWTVTEEEQRHADALLLSTARRPVRPGDQIQLPGNGSTWIAVPEEPGLPPDHRLLLEDAEEYYGRQVSALILLPQDQYAP